MHVNGELKFACWKSQLAYDQLTNALEKAEQLHHELEENHFGGETDKNWETWYAGFAMGFVPQIADKVSPSHMAGLLVDIPDQFISDKLTWAESAAWYVIHTTTGDSCLI